MTTDIYGTEAGAGRALAQSGFNAIGNLGGIALENQFSRPSSSPSLLDAGNTSGQYRAGEKISGQTGSFLEDEYSQIRRRRN